MKNLLNQFVVLFESNDNFQRKMGSYERAIKTEDWAFMRDAIMMMQGQMAMDMFSRAHTLLDQHEKDVVQQTYYNINQILTFLLDPDKWIKRRHGKWATALSNLKGKVNPNQTEGD